MLSFRNVSQIHIIFILFKVKDKNTYKYIIGTIDVITQTQRCSKSLLLFFCMK